VSLNSLTKHAFLIENKSKAKNVNKISTMLTRVARGCSRLFVAFTAKKKKKEKKKETLTGYVAHFHPLKSNSCRFQNVILI